MQYNSGLVDFQTVLTADRQLISLEDSLAVSDGEMTANLVRLYKALGGGWSVFPTATHCRKRMSSPMDTETNHESADVAHALGTPGSRAPAPWKRWAQVGRSRTGRAHRRLSVFFGRGGSGDDAVRDAGCDARRHDRHRDRHRQSRAAQPGRYRQRAVGHGPQRRSRCERRGEGRARCWPRSTPRG